jgi:ribonuclease P protein component
VRADGKSWRRAARRAVIASRPIDPRGLAFPRDARLVRKSEFDAVYRAGQRRSGAHFTIFLRANGLSQTRFGFSIKKALGNAVVRNRIRRRVREIVRCHRWEIASGWDIVIHPKSKVARAEFAALTAEFLRLAQGL